jgi:hypothetical protein
VRHAASGPEERTKYKLQTGDDRDGLPSASLRSAAAHAEHNWLEACPTWGRRW